MSSCPHLFRKPPCSHANLICPPTIKHFSRRFFPVLLSYCPKGITKARYARGAHVKHHLNKGILSSLCVKVIPLREFACLFFRILNILQKPLRSEFERNFQFLQVPAIAYGPDSFRVLVCLAAPPFVALDGVESTLHQDSTFQRLPARPSPAQAVQTERPQPCRRREVQPVRCSLRPGPYA